MDIHRRTAEPWRVTLVDTGDETQTGGRLKRIMPYLAGEEIFGLTYGDGVADIDLAAQLAFHKAHQRKATVTAVRPAKRFGAISLDRDIVTSFNEKQADGRRRMDQRRIFPADAVGGGPDRRRRDGLGARADGAAGAFGQSARIRAPRVLASDGHLA